MMARRVMMASAHRSEDPQFVVLWKGGSPVVLDGSDPSKDVTSTVFDPGGFTLPAFSASYEKMVHSHGTNILTFGGFDRNGALPSGAALDFTNRENWFFVSGFPLRMGSSGNSYVRMGAANSAGYLMFYHAETEDAVISDFTRADYGPGPSSHNIDPNPGFLKCYEDMLFIPQGSKVRRYNWDGEQVTGTSSFGIPFSASYTGDLSKANGLGLFGVVGIAHSDIAIVDWSGAVIHNIGALMASQGLTAPNDFRACEFSPDNRYFLFGGEGGSLKSGGFVAVYDLQTTTLSSLSVPSGGANDKINSLAWYPDSDRYVIGGYHGAKGHFGAVSAGGVTTTFEQLGLAANAGQGGVAVIPFAA
jgi:WD40 repeat protein